MKKTLRNKKNLFEEYRAGLAEDELLQLEDFFTELGRHVTLDRDDSLWMKMDFEMALLYYHQTGISLAEALERLSIRNLGGFYARPPVLWYPLDDAAKMYPLSMKHGQMAVFRLSAYLKEEVVPELLQIALTFTIKRFPSFATTVKKGFFWHYLDTSKKRYPVEAETDIPCRPMNISQSGSQSFRILYHDRRISAEFFHILTDGTGGITFLKTLLREYLRLQGKVISDLGIPDINQMPPAAELYCKFPELEEAGRWSGFVEKPALQFSGKLSRLRMCRVLHMKLDAAKLHEEAQQRGCTVTTYLLAQLFIAGRYATDEFKGEMNIQVPVNLRKFFPSETMRNFFMCCGIRMSIEEIDREDELIMAVGNQLAEKASQKSMSEMMGATSRLIKAVKYIPRSVKAPVARLVYGFLGDRVFSNTFSNLGVVTVPQEMAEHIESMDFILGTSITNRACCTLVTFGNTATLTVAKLTSDPSFEEKLADLLSSRGLLMSIEGSEPYEG